MINVDFADVRTVMSEMGLAMMGTGVARGDNRARKAAEAAIEVALAMGEHGRLGAEMSGLPPLMRDKWRLRATKRLAVFDAA